MLNDYVIGSTLILREFLVRVPGVYFESNIFFLTCISNCSFNCQIAGHDSRLTQECSNPLCIILIHFAA